MPTVVFTSALERHVGHIPALVVTASTVRAALDAAFVEHPRLRSYVLDDQGALRQHVAAFVDGVQVQDRVDLSDAVGPDGSLYVMQALSGG